ncbi:unnamed protein product [Calicophoron daubneyi]|uniref:APC membrane recruitment protein 1 n=1 Tax=Calicophoron daubneyi TaxID=300641 RepID=A0AAV2TGA6_CALDB
MRQDGSTERSVHSRANNSQRIVSGTDSPNSGPNETVGVGKCGDADPSITEYDCERHETGELSGETHMASADYSFNALFLNPKHSRSSSAETKKSDVHRRTPSYLKSSDSLILNEPPKLRRGLAYLEFDDGDCERDGYTKSLNCSKSDESETGFGDKSSEIVQQSKIKSNGSSNTTWPSRVYKAFKQNFLFRRTRRDGSSRNSLLNSGERKLEVNIHHAGVWEVNKLEEPDLLRGWTFKHLPNGDLFHQFEFDNNISSSRSSLTPLAVSGPGE